MSTEDSKQLVIRWFTEVWNEGREEAIDSMFAPDGVANGLAGNEGGCLRGTGEFKSFFRGFRGAFPDIRVTVENLVAEGDMVASRCTVDATHTGDGIGIAATGNRISIEGMCMLRVEGGKIREAWNNFDFLTMFRQLGVTQPPDEYTHRS